MNILYVILTCEKFLNSRRIWQMETWLKNIKHTDNYIFLSAKSHPEKKVIGFNTEDSYQSASYKHVEFIKNYSIDSTIDWIFFCDDDTFVYPKRLENLIEQEKKENKTIGRLGVCKANIILKDNNKIKFPIFFPSGGAGFAINRNHFFILKEYLLKNIYPVLLNIDVTFGAWFRENNINIIDRGNVLKAQNPDHPENFYVINPVTYHYCSEAHFKELNKI